AERPEHERGADAGKSEQLVDGVAERREDALADRRLQHDQREEDLQAEPPGDRRPVDRAAVGREGDGDTEDHDRAEERLKDAGHQRTSATISGTAAGARSAIAIAWPARRAAASRRARSR